MAKSLQIANIIDAIKDPRQRMKEVRAEVRMYVEGGTNPWGIPHIGHLYEDQADMRRAMIALHDMYDDRAQRHNKASKLVADLIDDNDRISQGYFESMNMVDFLNNAGEILRGHYDEAIKENQKLKEDLAVQDRKLEAVLITLSTVMEG